MDPTRASDHFTEREHTLADPPICVLCDEGGGELVFCDGPCHRHFHWNADHLELPLICNSLSLKRDIIEKEEPWECTDCERRIQTCFVCNVLGYMDPEVVADPDQVVFPCVDLPCVQFYHRLCVESELKSNSYLPIELELPVAFKCPRHFCHGCSLEEIDTFEFARCLRCTNSWHETCIKADYNQSWINDGHGIFTQELTLKSGRELLWQNVYCPNHELDPVMGIPLHDLAE